MPGIHVALRPSRGCAESPPLRRLTDGWPGSGGQLFRNPEDFQVDELLPYPPSGEGEHLFVRIRKTGLDSIRAARSLAEALGVIEAGEHLPAEVGLAGLKDRHAIASQWISLPWPLEQKTPEPKRIDPRLEILEVRRHSHKLRKGHVAANDFRITLREVPRGGTTRAQRILERLRVVGMPNRYGPQRFGRDGSNPDRARAILNRQSRRPRDRNLWSLLRSSLQSEVFNRVLDLRIGMGILTLAILGDRMVKHASGGQFDMTDPRAEQPRVDALEISPTGPLPGKRSRPPFGVALEIERAALADSALSEAIVRQLGVGSRRPLRLPLERAHIESIDADEETESFRLSVRLPAGAYATVLLDELVKPEHGEAFDRS